ncbi:integral membrane sensor signal transduction histidine kinase (plasmid) [Stanieria cyanosphaera PCC 7437]|uniref:histidine kinase n=1 Tax=Stanieria cyanosphaera (strain ATCC 29371 / PCC 7437) TaxID=111780 RepID=K9Y1U9_STAC7|nr:two-component system sensor histidine kinase RppB [Stanieria cyanosphaera]AFZ38386.1 integral membrane sensor signal transduction histidine kinase [Stanieria cyanosphaera PCC 7437]
MNGHHLFRRSRIRLALWYAFVMGAILSLSGLGMYRAMVRVKWTSLEREIESIAGTLHDSLEPMLPVSEAPTPVLQQIFPDLCLTGQFCNLKPTLIPRHTIGIGDRDLYYLRLFDHYGKLLAFSPNQPAQLPQTLNSAQWQTFNVEGIRYHQFTITLHSANTHHLATGNSSHPSWGYLQIGRTLETYDSEVRQIQLILAFGLPIALGLVAVSSWYLAGLAMQPIYQSYQQQQQFTANAAHELRSPLASLLATVEAILRLPPGHQQDVPSMLQRVERQGRRLSHLIADLLLLVSLEQNSSPKPFQPCCLNDLIADLTEELAELATASNIHLTSQVPHFEIYVLGNESQLYRLVSNLIANAIQYTSTGGYVQVSLSQSDHNAILAIEDTGMGISSTEQSLIFERFYRVNSDRSRQTGGTGLGLAIASAIAHRHQGHLKVNSELGKGSVFTIYLPCIH